MALASLADGVGFVGAGLALAGLAEAGFSFVDLGPAVSLVEAMLAFLSYLLNIILICGVGRRVNRKGQTVGRWERQQWGWTEKQERDKQVGV